jgi:hypothetical protein
MRRPRVADDVLQWRELTAHPPARYTDAKCERVISAAMPPRPDRSSYIGNSSMATADCVYAEVGGSEGRGGGPRRGHRGPSDKLRAAWVRRRAARATGPNA